MIASKDQALETVHREIFNNIVFSSNAECRNYMLEALHCKDFVPF